VKADGKNALVGITDFAQSHLGEIVFVDLPDVGEEVVKTQACGAVESVKAVGEIYAPVSGRIIAVNKAVQGDKGGELVNKDPYKAGWMFQIAMKEHAELDNLLDPEAYKKVCETE